MPMEKSEERIKFEKFFLKHMKDNVNKDFSIRDIKKFLGLKYDIWMEDRILRKLITDYCHSKQIIISKFRPTYHYKYNEEKIELH